MHKYTHTTTVTTTTYYVLGRSFPRRFSLFSIHGFLVVTRRHRSEQILEHTAKRAAYNQQGPTPTIVGTSCPTVVRSTIVVTPHYITSTASSSSPNTTKCRRSSFNDVVATEILTIPMGVDTEEQYSWLTRESVVFWKRG